MLDERPTAAELIAAVADFLEKKAVPELQGHTAFHTKVAINALRIVERELQQSAAFENSECQRIRTLTGNADTDLNALNRALCAQISNGTLASDNTALREHLLQSVLARIAIDSPKYPSRKAV
jgi:hypothetical protein